MDTPYKFVEEIINRFGPRKAGSDAERGAQLFLKQHLETYCDSVEVHEFEDALNAKFSSLRLFCSAYYISLVLIWVSLPIALALATVNSIVFFFHFVSYYNWLDFLYPKKRSLNIAGTIEPESEVRSTLIFCGHMDSTPEFIWWYWLKDWGIRLMILSSLAFVTLPILLLLMQFGIAGTTVHWIYIGLIPATFSFFFIHGKRVIDGAQDNLSGIAVAEAVSKSLVGKLKHTRIKMVSFGSEEVGLKGSGAYVRAHRDVLLKENASVINLDGILEIEEMHLIEKEISLFVKHDQKLIKKVNEAFESHDIATKRGFIPVGATDGASFSLKGIPALSIVGLPMNGLHPTYHTRLDVLECLSSDTLDKVTKALQTFAINHDKGRR